MSQKLGMYACIQKKLLVGKSAVIAGTLPAEWGAPGSFPQLELLSISMTHISGGHGASTTDACTNRMRKHGCMHHRHIQLVLKHFVD